MTMRGGQPHKSEPGDISVYLRAWSDGDQCALDRMPLIVYDQLHRLAGRYLKRERAGHSVQTTALVNEAYIRLVVYKRMHWRDRGHFFAVSAQLMRRLLVEHARRLKRGRDVVYVSLDDTAVLDDGGGDLMGLDDGMTTLGRLGQGKMQVVEMRFFGGLGVEGTVEVLKVSPKYGCVTRPRPGHGSTAS